MSGPRLNDRYRDDRVKDAIDFDLAPARPARWRASAAEQAAIVDDLCAAIDARTDQRGHGRRANRALIAGFVAEGLTARELVPNGTTERYWAGEWIYQRQWSAGRLANGQRELLASRRLAATRDQMLDLLRNRAIIRWHELATEAYGRVRPL